MYRWHVVSHLFLYRLTVLAPAASFTCSFDLDGNRSRTLCEPTSTAPVNQPLCFWIIFPLREKNDLTFYRPVSSLQIVG